MDRIAQLEQIVLECYQEYSDYFNLDENSEVQHFLIADKENKRYMLLWMGFKGKRYIHLPIFHTSIKNGKIWLHQDKSESGLLPRLMKKGLTEADIVLAQYTPSYRALLEFAVE